MSNAGDSLDLVSLLASPNRDYLIRNTAEQVKIESLKRKEVGLYFSASWCIPCHYFNSSLLSEYRATDIEIVLISADEDDESFKEFFSNMPWLAIPFSDSDTRDNLNDIFVVHRIPYLVILDENGEVRNRIGREILGGFYSVTEAMIQQKELEVKATWNKSLISSLVSGSRDYVISSDGNKLPISELQGKIVGIYSSDSSNTRCIDFTSTLVEVYEKLKSNGENFEVVFVSWDYDKENFQRSLGDMPWLALPFSRMFAQKLAQYFELSPQPILHIIGPDGKTLQSDAVAAIEEHGIQAYPFTPEKLAEIEKTRKATQTLETVLVSGEQNFVIGKDGAQILVSDLVGKTKNILLYFAAHWHPECRAFLPELIEVYHNIKAKDNAFEVIFISSDEDQASFDDFFSEMPWLALPFGDVRNKSFIRKFNITGTQMLIPLGPKGQVMRRDADLLVAAFGADAFPFTIEHLEKITEKCDAMAEEWPKKMKHELHEEHEIVLSHDRAIYKCDGCNGKGIVWSFCCEKCDFYLHPKCALGVKDGEQVTKEGWIWENLI